MMRLLENISKLAILLLFPSLCFADYQLLTVTGKTVNGQTMLCYKDLVTQTPRCMRTKSILKPVKSTDPELRIQEVVVTDVGVLPEEKGIMRFGGVVKWKANGGGTLAISGPEGRIFAIGSLAMVDGEVAIQIERFSDEKLSQQLDRSVLFGETDPMHLHVRTQMWLEQVLLPAIQETIRSSKIAVPSQP